MQYYFALPINGIQTNTASTDVGSLGSMQLPVQFHHIP